MTLSTARINNDGEKETLTFIFVKGWKPMKMTAQEAFDNITVDGHPFGVKKEND